MSDPKSNSIGSGKERVSSLQPEQDSECLLRVDGVSKKFCRSLKLSLWYGLQDVVSELNPFSARAASVDETAEEALRAGEFWATRDVSFTLKRGECLGLIGHNGAGKTTLLRMLNGLIKPDGGSIEIQGRVGALIALGAGFNPILSGRENIYVNGAVLGLGKGEIDEKIDEIIAFSELEEFIDAPVQSYSSGMSVRLGFAIASTLQPDVLLLDEVLAVGDTGFAVKCLNRVRELASNSAVILVSHNMNSIASFCTRVLLLDHGKIVIDTKDIGLAVDQYNRMIKSTASTAGSGGLDVRSIDFHVDGLVIEDGLPHIDQGKPGSLKMTFEIDGSVRRCRVIPYVADETHFAMIGFPLIDEEGKEIWFGPGKHHVTVPLGPMEMNPGNYSFIVLAEDADTGRYLRRDQGLVPFRVRSTSLKWGKFTRPARVS
jgi:lipopolysaccharide transport system ATP-binding protein